MSSSKHDEGDMAPSMTLPLGLGICMNFLRRSSYARRLSKAGPKSRCLDSCATSTQFFKYFAACKQDHFFSQNIAFIAVEPKPINFDSWSALIARPLFFVEHHIEQSNPKVD